MEPKDIYFKRKLLDSAKRLVRLLELCAPNFILARETVTVFRLGTVLSAEGAGDGLANYLAEHTANGNGYCSFEGCQNELVLVNEHTYYCTACIEKIRGEFGPNDEEYDDTGDN